MWRGSTTSDTNCSEMKKLIITADDFGYSLGRNRAIVECYQRGVVSRSSIIVNAVQVDDAVRQARRHRIPLGLHLNLTEGFPISDPRSVNSLVDPDTHTFHGKMGFRKVLMQGGLDFQQVAIEIKAQMEKFIQLTKNKPVFVDGHQHVHILPGICEVFASNSLISETRLPFERNILTCDWMEEAQRQFFTTVLDNCSYAVDIFNKNSISHPVGFVGLSTMGSNMSFHRITTLILATFHRNNNDKNTSDTNSQLEDSDFVCELMVHPGYPTETDNRTAGYPAETGEKTAAGNHTTADRLNVIGSGNHQAGCGTGPDYFEQSKEREHELSVLCSDQLIGWLKSENIVLCESVNS